MANAAMANFNAIRVVYGSQSLLDGDGLVDESGNSPSVERTCYFHFEQSLVSHMRLHILPEYQADHLRLCRSWVKACTRVLFNEGLESIKKLWLTGALNSIVHVAKLGSWLAFWEKRSHHFAWYCIDELDLSLEEEAFIPTTNLSESAHSSMWVTQGNGPKVKIDLVQAVMQDMTRSIL
jgi:hypothetical protein